jgi:hypothetical protein
MSEENQKEELKTLPPEHAEVVAQALVNAGAAGLVPVLVHSLKAAVGACVDDLALNIKTVDLGAASGVVNLLAGNIASAIKAWVNTLSYPAPRPPSPGPAPYPGPQPYYPPQPAPQPPQPQPYYPPQPQPQPQPAPYYPPQPPQPYYPPQPQPAPQPPQPPRGPEINVR